MKSDFGKQVYNSLNLKETPDLYRSGMSTTKSNGQKKLFKPLNKS